jgi:hypothetical protein
MLAIIIGAIFFVAGLIGLIRWWMLFLMILKGVLPFLLLGGGILAITAGYTSIRDSFFAKKIIDDAEKESK